MDRDAVWAAIDAERSSLADLLATLTPQEWDVRSLCPEWTVREVAAHITLSHVAPGRALVEGLRYRGSFNTMVRETARRRARAESDAQLIARMRAMPGSRKHPIGTSYLDPLVDSLVHGQDIAVPLGRPREMPVDAAVTAADRVWSMGFPFGARRKLRGLRFEATDAEWAQGDGTVLRGPIAVLLLVLTGRRARLGELTGAGVAVLDGSVQRR
jgi:uncharacterized protein (TIGR03083 family)